MNEIDTKRYEKAGEDPLFKELLEDSLTKLVLKRDNQSQQALEAVMKLTSSNNNDAKNSVR